MLTGGCRQRTAQSARSWCDFSNGTENHVTDPRHRLPKIDLLQFHHEIETPAILLGGEAVEPLRILVGVERRFVFAERAVLLDDPQAIPEDRHIRRRADLLEVQELFRHQPSLDGLISA
jgi:hypothetical protein